MPLIHKRWVVEAFGKGWGSALGTGFDVMRQTTLGEVGDVIADIFHKEVGLLLEGSAFLHKLGNMLHCMS